MASSTQEMEEELEEFEIELTSKFQALKEFTFRQLRSTDRKVNEIGEKLSELEGRLSEINFQEEFDKLDDSLGSLKGEFETFKSAAPSTSGWVDDTRKHKTSEKERVDTTKKKKTIRGFKGFEPLTTSPVSTKMAKTLDDVEKDSLRKALEKYYSAGPAQASKLTAVQNAYFQYFMTEKKDGYTAKRTVIEDLIRAGVKDGMWPQNYEPEGIKNSFFDYLREKAKNAQKKKLAEKALLEFADEFELSGMDDI